MMAHDDSDVEGARVEHRGEFLRMHFQQGLRARKVRAFGVGRAMINQRHLPVQAHRQIHHAARFARRTTP